MEESAKEFREWALQQYNKDGVVYKEKSISNYNSSLNTILGKLHLDEKYGFASVYSCDDVELFESLYIDIFTNPKFGELNLRFNHTHSAALNLYRRYVRYLEAQKIGVIKKAVVDNEADGERTKAKALSDTDLLIRVKNKENTLYIERTVISTSYIRDQEIAEYAIRRADGKCDLCRNEAPFNKKDGTPYLEAHHGEWLARGGSDVIENVVALCPTCHRRIHVLDRKEDTVALKRRLRSYYMALAKTE